MSSRSCRSSSRQRPTSRGSHRRLPQSSVMDTRRCVSSSAGKNGEWCADDCGKGSVPRGREEGGKRTSLRILTLPRMPSTCASFWLSSSLSTASLYWPLFHGVCVSACWVPLLYAASLSLHRPLLRAPLPTIQKSHLLPQKSSCSQPQQSVFTQRTQNRKSLPPIRRRTAILAHPTARRTKMCRRPASCSYTAAVAIPAADRGAC